MARFGFVQLCNQTPINSSVYVYLCVCVVCTYMFPCSPQVVVSVGRSLSYTPGSITLLTSAAFPFPVATVAGGVAGGGVSLILLIVAIILVACRRESVMRSQVDVLLMQMKTLAERGKHVRCTCVCMYAHMCLYVSCFFFFVIRQSIGSWP